MALWNFLFILSILFGIGAVWGLALKLSEHGIRNYIAQKKTK